ncbi:AMP-binding protein [Rubritalea spongiae]|uniref:AMP-binding protein n=1 Tax=Rubritalea spongiae TaxID=430797 RepID=A0ABW5E4L8_9BACT
MCNPFNAGDTERLNGWLDQQEDESFRHHVYFQTSGSSGKAKWVALSKSALLASARGVNRHLEIETGAKWALCLPIFHVGGFGVLVRSFLTGGHCQVFHEKWDAVAFSRFMFLQRAEYVSLVPTQVVDLVESRCVAPDSVKAVIVGGGKLEDSYYERAVGLGWPILRSYGMTEAGSQIATGGDDEEGMKVLDIWQVRVGEDGLLEWKGEAGMSFYIEETEEGFRRVDPKRDGWFLTQDRVRIENGRLRMLGRIDSLVKVLGELVDLTLIEERIQRATGKECVVLTQPDARRGVKLFPIVESSEDVVVPEFSGIESLEEIRIISSFPRTRLGKVIRAELRGMIER